MFVRATPYSKSFVDIVFDISGIEETIEPLRQACGWSEAQIQERKRMQAEAEKKMRESRDKRIKDSARKQFDIWFSEVKKSKEENGQKQY